MCIEYLLLTSGRVLNEYIKIHTEYTELNVPWMYILSYTWVAYSQNKNY